MSIWKTLSAIDCNQHVEKKGQFSYLSWTWAWAMVAERYQDAKYRIEDDIVYPDGTMEVRCTVTIGDLSHTMWLPVLDHKNKAIINPNAFDVNSSRMRCLVKCLAMFGLGHYIYSGESAPQAPPITDEQLAMFKTLLAKGEPIPFMMFMSELSEEAQAMAFNSAPAGEKMKLKEAVRAMQKEGEEIIGAYVSGIEEAIEAGDQVGFQQLADELSPFLKRRVWARLTEIQKEQIKQLMEQAA